MKNGFLHNMAPNAQRSFAATLAFSAVAVAIYMFGVLPARDSLAREERRKDELSLSQNRIRADLANSGNVKKTLEELDEKARPFMEAMLTPLHHKSYAMRAKDMLDPLVLGAGMTGVNYKEEKFLALPVPNPLPVQLYERASIKLTAIGSCQAALSFLLRLERDFPLEIGRAHV